MSDVDSPPEPAAGPQVGQEPSADKSSPEARINGLMSVLGKRTTERDEARRESEALRLQLDTAFAQERDAPPPEYDEPEPQPDARDDDEPIEQRYTLDEARDVIEANEPVGHIDVNNPSRAQNGAAEPTVGDMRRQLDDGWSSWQAGE